MCGEERRKGEEGKSEGRRERGKEGGRREEGKEGRVNGKMEASIRGKLHYTFGSGKVVLQCNV